MLQLPDFQCCGGGCQSSDGSDNKLTNIWGQPIVICCVCDGLKLWKKDGHKWYNNTHYSKRHYLKGYSNNYRILITFDNRGQVEFYKSRYWWYVYTETNAWQYNRNILTVIFCLDGHNLNLENNLRCEECKLNKINLLYNNNTLFSTIPTPLIHKIVEYDTLHYDKLVQKEFACYLKLK